MTSEKKKTTLIILFLHILQFVFVASMMFLVLSRTNDPNEVSTVIDQAALTQKNVQSSVIIGLASAVSGFLGWYYYLLPMMRRERNIEG